MVLSGSENNEIAFGNISKPNSPLEDETLPFKDDPCLGNSSLSRQNSTLFSLTLNEIQNKSGRSVGSMNMDEFLANLWSVDIDDNNVDNEENQVDLNGNNNDEHNANGGTIANANNPPKPAPLARKGSFSIPAPLCKKTVDEIWFEIQKDQPNGNRKPNLNLDAPVETPPLARHRTLGEMTLEDFLVKAGVVSRAPQGVSIVSGDPASSTPTIPGASSLQKMVTPLQNINACLDATFGIGPVMGMTFPPPPPNIGIFPPNPNGGFGPYPMFPPAQNKGYVGEPPNNDATPNVTNDQAHTESSGQQSKKRIIDGPPEVLVGRRQRRMIKNRESAARSRARKQAYTVELELELTQLREENLKLKNLVEEIEQNRKEEVLKMKSKKTQKDEKMNNVIRRTVSLAW